MKKCSSVVWRFFERVEENSRCVAVVCKLCETQYKYFGNTTNLRAHLTNKHPIQWELSHNGKLEESQFRIVEEEPPTPQKRRKYGPRRRKDQNVRYSLSVNKEDDSGGSGIVPKVEMHRVDVLANSDSDNDEDNDATANLVRQMHGIETSDVEWLEEDPYQITHIETYEPTNKKMKYKKIKREVSSPSGLPSYYVTPQTKKRVLVEEQPKNDEYSVFGEYIANKLRKFNSPRTRGNLQQLITTILWQAEYGLYDNADAVKRVLMYSVPTPEPDNSRIEYESQMHNIHTEEIIEQREDENDSNQSPEIEINFK